MTAPRRGSGNSSGGGGPRRGAARGGGSTGGRGGSTGGRGGAAGAPRGGSSSGAYRGGGAAGGRPAGGRAGGSGGSGGGGYRGASSGREQASGGSDRRGGQTGRGGYERGPGGAPRADRPRSGASGDAPARREGGRPDWRDRRPTDQGRSGGAAGGGWRDRRTDAARGASGAREGRGDAERRDRRPAAAEDRRDRRPAGAGEQRDWRDRRPSRSGERTDRRPAGTGERGNWRERRPQRGSRPDADLAPRRPAGPPLPDWADPRELDRSVRAALRGLDPRNAELVAKHLVVAGTLVDEDPEQALAHARAARDRASRVAAVREAVGVAAYHAGDYAEAARELRAYRRMSGDETYRAVLADCERALGRPEVALRLVAEALGGRPDRDEVAELRLVEAGARRDLGETAAARLLLEDALGGRPDPDRLAAGADPAHVRYAAAYADLLEAQGETERAERWREAVLAADPEGATGAVERPEVEFDEFEDDAGADAGGDAPVPGGTGDGEDPAGDVTDEAAADADVLDVDVLDEDVTDDDIAAEVAELLGEDPPQR